jgi:UDP-N-acetylglucosamine--N-acetylmuramyl-(pentapeptide) pyrophosphoryl-undecaprenol N-acetylglucosamine transferase
LIFIFGGSQGSQALNRVIAQSQESLHSFSIVHGVGQANELPPSTTTYKATHYISDMAQHYLAADLIIGRSGAVTCAEVDALGKFALFIPLPIGNGEQALNATELVKAGRAEVVTQDSFTPTWLATNIERLMQMSKGQSDSGNTAGLHSVTKIADMIESALRG